MEIIKANGVEYATKSVTTGTNSISFTMEGQEITATEAAFREVTELDVIGEDKTIYGTYENLVFESATVYEDGTVSVTMHIKTADELWKESVETSQAEQDEAIATMMFGGEE